MEKLCSSLVKVETNKMVLKREKRKKTNLSDPKQHHQSVEDFCDLDSVPGEICKQMFEA